MKKYFEGKKNAKKLTATALVLLMTAALFTGCGSKSDEGDEGKARISVIARETGSGTRSAFNELMGISVDEKDMTTPYAEVSQSTAVVIATVAGNENAIGYISLGSLNDSVKAISIDGSAATVENIKAGSYAASRPFLMITKEGRKAGEARTRLAEDFEKFVLSKQGQEIVAEEGYIPTDDNVAEYKQAQSLEGKLVIAGSTSVAPVMQKIADAYKTIHEGVSIEIQQTGSGAGITSTVEGACDIGMSSRDLKPEEEAEGLESTELALDGIAVIVNKENAVSDMTSEQLRQIFTGEVTQW